MSAYVTGLVWRAQVYNGGRLLVLLNLADHARDDGSNVRPGTGRVAAQTGMDRRSVQRHLRALEADGVVVEDGWFAPHELRGGRDAAYGRHRIRVWRIDLGRLAALAEGRLAGPEPDDGAVSSPEKGDSHAALSESKGRSDAALSAGDAGKGRHDAALSGEADGERAASCRPSDSERATPGPPFPSRKGGTGVARTSKEEDIYISPEIEAAFERLWEAFPLKAGDPKTKGLEAFAELVVGGVDPERLVAAAAGFRRYIEGGAGRWSVHVATWLRQRRFESQPEWRDPGAARTAAEEGPLEPRVAAGCPAADAAWWRRTFAGVAERSPGEARAWLARVECAGDRMVADSAFVRDYLVQHYAGLFEGRDVVVRGNAAAGGGR